MAQRVKALAAEPDSRSSTPETHMVQGENGQPHAVLWSPHAEGGMHGPFSHIQTQIDPKYITGGDPKKLEVLSSSNHKVKK